jgi:hypothetical protein
VLTAAHVLGSKDEAEVFVGFPWGKRLGLFSGIVSQVPASGKEDVAADEGDEQTIVVDAAASKGVSGGGVFREATGSSSAWSRATRPPRSPQGSLPDPDSDRMELNGRLERLTERPRQDGRSARPGAPIR